MSQDSLILHDSFRCYNYLLLGFCLRFMYCQDTPHLLIALTSGQLSSIYTGNEHGQFLRIIIIFNFITLQNNFSQGLSVFFGSVNTGELPNCKQKPRKYATCRKQQNWQTTIRIRLSRMEKVLIYALIFITK